MEDVEDVDTSNCGVRSLLLITHWFHEPVTTYSNSSLCVRLMMFCFFFHVQDAFFCKVQDILQHNNFTKLVVDGQYITENLKMYLHPEEVRIFRQPSARYLSIGAAIVSIFFSCR